MLESSHIQSEKKLKYTSLKQDELQDGRFISAKIGISYKSIVNSR
jgi:hypothetical protein